jgi:predicted protein tyrosine phosphatase
MSKRLDHSVLPFRLSICGVADLPLLAGLGITHLLSVDRSGQPTPTPKWFDGTHLHVFFDDVESETEAKEHGTTPPTLEEIDKALAFGRKCLDDSRQRFVHLLIHCTQGASRSPAVAYAIAAMVLGPGQEKAALKHVLGIRKYAFPNRLVVHLADQLLKRNGSLKASLETLWKQADEYRPVAARKKGRP